MMLTMAVSTQMFHAPITPQLVLAVTLVATSTLQYNLPKELLRDDDDAQERLKLISSDAHEESPSDTELTTTSDRPSKLPTGGA